MTKRNDRVFIEHVLESIGAIKDFSKDMSKEAFMESRLKQSAIIREIEVIGEAMKNVSKHVKSEYPEIAWKEIIGSRDKIIHQYFGVDLNIIWDIVKNDLPLLEDTMKEIKKNLVR